MDVTALQKWIAEEIYPQSKEHCSSSRLPSIADLQEMCRGRNAEIWEYAMKHVFSAQTVQKVKGNLKLKHALRNQPDNELVQRKSELIDQLLKARAKKKHLEKTVTEVQSKIVEAESRITASKTKITQLRHKKALREKYSCLVKEKVTKYEGMNAELKKRIDEFQHTTKYSKNTLHPLPHRDDNLSSGRDPGLESSISNAVDEVVEIIQKKYKTVDDKHPPLDRTALHIAKKGIWQEMNNILQDHSFAQVIKCVTAHAQEASMNIKKQCEDTDLEDSKNFKFKQTSVNNIPNSPSKSFRSVNNFLEGARELHIKKFLETVKNENAAAKLNKEIEEFRKTIRSKLSMSLEGKKEELELIMSLLEMEAKLAGTKNVTKNLKKELACVEVNIANVNQVKMDLLSKYQKIENFQKIVEDKQDLLCSFLKHNLDTAEKATILYEQLKQYMEDTVLKNRMQIEERVHQLRHCVEKEVTLFKSLYLPHLLTTSLESCKRVPVQSLSIYIPHGHLNLVEMQEFYSLTSALNFFPFEGSEYLLKKAISMKTMLQMNRAQETRKKSILCQMKKKREEKSSTLCITDLTSQIKVQDRDDLQNLLPHLKVVSLDCEKGTAMCRQLQESLQDWKEQPAQLLVPDVTVEGKTLQQWLNLWSTVSMELTNMRSNK